MKTISPQLRDVLQNNVFDAQTLIEQKHEVISLSPQLNYLLGGGISTGSFGIITGKQKLGKTATCLYIAKKAQEAGYKVVFLNAEHRLTNRDLTTTAGLDLSAEKFQIFQSTPSKILTAEDFMEAAQYSVSTEDKCLVIADSVSMMCPNDLIEGSIRDKFRDTSPALMSRFCKVMLPYVSVSNNMFVAVTHLMANTSGMGYSTVSEASGTKIQYAESWKLKAFKTEDILNTDKVKVGLSVHFQCVNTSIGVAGRKGVCKLLFDTGISELYETVEMAKDCHTPSLYKKGTWWIVGDEKIQGEPKLINFLKEQPDLVTQIRGEIKEALGVDYNI